MTADGPLLGFRAARSNTIVAIEECVIARPEIAGQLAMLRTLVEVVGTTREVYHIEVTVTRNGLDISLSGLDESSDSLRRTLSNFATANKLARISIGDEIVLAPSDAAVSFGDTSVTLPPGGFLQAVREMEIAMAGLVCDHLAKAKQVADLFAGSGTFALRLAERSPVHAVEGDQAALDALYRGFRFGQGLRRVTTEKRDLFRRPLTTRELNEFSGIVFDPPRVGAEAQCAQIAQSSVPKVAAVSCNPATLARDLRILINGGYAVESITPIDQFLWSPHVEAVALLSKKPPRKRRR